VTPKFVSPSDPAAQWTGAMRGPAFFAYADNYLIDVKFGIIGDVEASRKIPRNIHEDARDVARALVGTAAFEQSRRNRKRVEMLFAHLKRILRLGRLRLRGPRGAQDEFTLGAIAQNLRRLAKLVARPPPTLKPCAA
jgi:Transposase DDE domain